MELPKVAIIISNDNYGKYVVEAIKSALNQDYEGDIRVVVVDDGSSDGSWEMLNEHFEDDWTSGTDEHQVSTPYYSGPMKFFVCDDLNLWVFNIRNSGASTARNVAIWEAWQWADYFAILDADDMYDPSKVKKHVDKMMEHDELGVTYSDYVIHRTVNGSNYNKYEYKYPYSRDELRRQCIVHSAGVIKKGFLESVVNLENKEFYNSALHGPGSQEFIGCTEDYDLWLRLSDVCMMSHIPEPLSIVRETGQNQSMKMTPEIFQNNAAIISGGQNA